MAIWLTAFGAPVVGHRALPKNRSTPVVFFDVSELPARIDEPRMLKGDKESVLDCAIANRPEKILLVNNLALEWC